MAATKKSAKTAKLQTTHNALQAMTAAALVLPGLLHSTAQATEDDEFSFQYGRYQEGSRNLGDTKLSYDPITVDSLQSGGKIKLTDRIKLAFNFSQDTWAGATPITTAPASRYGNSPVQNAAGTVVGASPYIQTFSDNATIDELMQRNAVYFDRNLKPLNVGADPDTFEIFSKGQSPLTHTMVSASPEVRKEGNFKLGYEWDEAAATIGGGISSERDYESRFTNAGLRLDFDQKRTTLDLAASYTNSFSHALLMHDAKDYFIRDGAGYSFHTENLPGGLTSIEGRKEDWTGSLNLTRVVSKYSVLKLGAGFTKSYGYMENPYKVVTAFYVQPVGGSIGDTTRDIPYVGNMRAFAENRPNNRNQLSLSAGWAQYIEPLDAALHFDYKYFFDDWGINAHTFEGDWVQPLGAGWTVTPRVRYYSQSAADFYYPYLVSLGTNQPTNNIDAYNRLPTKEFSSDHRLSAYGALSGGVMLSKQLAKGIRLDAGFEYYTHKGSLNIGSGGEGEYADFNYYLVSGALNVNISQLGRSLTESGHAHHHHMHHHGAPLPAGVMFGHMLPSADDVMVGYRYMYGRQDGDMLHGANKSLGDADIVAGGCLLETCRTAPTYMDMHMHMLDIMYAPTDWLNLMLMPQFMDMNMNLRGLSGVAPATSTTTDDHLSHGGHTTGGIADTSAYALFKLFSDKTHNVNLALGVSAPTGDSGITLNRWHKIDGGYIHYGMQLGSGTWDFKPSLTYTGHMDDWGWGAQVTGTTRLESANKYGYALGDILQTSAWGSYNVLDWLSASVRGVYTTLGAVKGRFDPFAGQCADNHNTINNPVYCDDASPKHGVMDIPGNYGGQYWDVGLGLNASVMDGAYAGHQFGVEWLQPVMENVNGYQLERFGTLNATWTYMF